ncbi:MAG: hypothetical protein D6796_01550 [Caldilineae bacterium]|nr:MAG: hypothetical protein D6796_01550 [Caldilineae bacterium]
MPAMTGDGWPASVAMIHVAGSAHRSFTFPADLPTTFAYYSDLGYILHFLPNIYVTRTYDANQFRVCYSATELGVYQVDIFCDLQATLDTDEYALRLGPLNGVSPHPTRRGIHSTAAAGTFASESLFFPDGDQTRIDYRLELRADLPTPLGLRFMPGKIINGIASSITHHRIEEIADGFIKRSIQAFPDWLGELGQDRLKKRR